MMRRQVLIDTGPLVAFINRRDQFNGWITEELATIKQPLLTCEAVLSEACFLLRNVYGGQEAVISLTNTGLIQIPFRLNEEAESIRELLTRYQSVPIQN